MLVPGTGGCSLIQFLPFLKPQVSTAPEGRTALVRGPAFHATPEAQPSTDWRAYNNEPTGTRYSPLAQITPANAKSLRPLCTYDTGERASMQSGPLAVGGTIYLTTAINTYAIDATTCRLRWKHTYEYNPGPDWDLGVNRGVAYLATADGPRLFRGSNDGRVYAMDARTGEAVWNVRAGDPRRGETFPAAPVAWNGLVYIGNAGGDNFGVTGRMLALDARTGAQVWRAELVPRSGPASFTWPPESNRVPRAGGATWTSYTLDTTSGRLYVPTGNAAPDFLKSVRPGRNLHTYSVVVLNARTGDLERAYQLLREDVHDWDVAAAPLLVTTARGRRLIVEAGKDGHVYGIDPSSGTFVYRTAVTTLYNVDAPLTAAGTRFCPGVQGGVEWNGPAYLPATNMLYVGSIDWCSTVAIAPPEKLRDKKGLPWTGSAKLREPFGKMDPRSSARGWVTALDADDGTIRWRYRSPTPMVAGVTATAGGIVVTADLQGHVLAFDARTGAVVFRYDTGQPVGGGVISYAVRGRQYIAVASGLHAPLTWQTHSTPARLVVLTLP